jgi:hypothetical protein
MAKQLFQSKAASIKQKMSFMVTAEIALRLENIERRAEKAGVSFPFNEHVEDAVLRLIRLAECQLDEIQPATEKHVGIKPAVTFNDPTA